MFSSKSSNGLIELNEYIQSITTPNLQQYDGMEVEIDEILDEFENPMTNPNGVIKIKRIL